MRDSRRCSQRDEDQTQTAHAWEAAGAHRDRRTRLQPCRPVAMRAVGGRRNPYLSWGGRPPGRAGQAEARMQVTSREARQALYWRICHRYTDTHRPHPRTRPGPSPGPRTADTGCPLPGAGGALGVTHRAVSPSSAASGSPGEEPALGGCQGPRGPGEAPQTHPGRPPSHSPSFPAGWAVNPRSWGQVQGPQAWAGWMGHTLGSGSASALAQACGGAPVSPREDAAGRRWCVRAEGRVARRRGPLVVSPCRIRDPGRGGALRLAPPGRARVRWAGRTRMGAAPCWGRPRGTGCGGRSRPCRGREAPRGRPPGPTAAPERGGRGESPEPRGPRPGSAAPRASLRCRPAKPLHLCASAPVPGRS